ncbi:hypothetical protein [Streptomyces tibetensis]
MHRPRPGLNGYSSYPAYDEAKACKELRPWCDNPGAVSNPRLPNWAS